ncbi:uncharacterized protein LOC101850443 [Aplysia californica]|uniref:NADH dehydrogenase [ubiquinone] 1 beta subcomplex subunit 4 n=1 Tax=Aplysia californica TaxID=6500 RepID=A0ABM0K5X6_APLCA|nr:uncharacterized protein LOC101850443 [Aplysia californica]
MAVNKRPWDPWMMYDATPEELRAIKERGKMRQALRSEWTKKFTNPWKSSHDGGFLFDPAVQRFIALKATQAERFKGTFRSAVVSSILFVLPVAILSYSTISKKEEREKRFRNGEVMYKDRESKFFY